MTVLTQQMVISKSSLTAPNSPKQVNCCSVVSSHAFNVSGILKIRILSTPYSGWGWVTG
jgi:hypothetical protein